MAQALGIVHIFVYGKPPNHGLPHQTGQRMAAVLAGAHVAEEVNRPRAEAEGVVEFAVGEQSSIGMIREPWNSSFSWRSKSSLRAPSIESPAGFATAAPCDPE
jgi:hypothetical protein